ncbi:hypothetical protein [Sphingomonas lenta]|uniref:Uncharacterized protein n=1 Tax=Sphingomonas lenta TaxID=1141887 RepID=A0A2A2SGB2_9SPHN|nr:hypothetical protein [Sphingomonas lenta]PAX08243.1 hypothetical protein CKY28_11820 [Sphingomonas lenta]
MRTLVLLPLALAACQQQPAETAATTNNTAAPAGYSAVQQRTLDLPEEQRRAVFLRAIRDGDAPCQGVTEAPRQPDQDGNPVFAAICTDGPVYAIALDRNGVAQVTRVSGERRG